MSKGYFDLQKINTLEDLKKQYKILALKLHPDRPNGNTQDFQAMQNEYDQLVNKVYAGANLSSEQLKNEIELDEIYKNIVDALISYPNINIEIIGTWIWVSANDYKDIMPLTKKFGNGLLDKLKFQYAPVKKMYYLDVMETGTKSKGKTTIEEIRNKYGTKTFKGKSPDKLTGVQKKAATSLEKNLKAAILRLKKRAKYISKIDHL